MWSFGFVDWVERSFNMSQITMYLDDATQALVESINQGLQEKLGR